MDLRKDTLFFDALVDFPTYGQEDKLYLDKSTGALYYWDGSVYAPSGGGGGGISSVTGTAPIASSGGANPAISISQATASTNGYLSSTDWTTFNGKQNAITLTTTGTSGAATLVGSTLNIPNYASGGLTFFTEAQSTSAPNATVPVDSLTAVSAATNTDIAIVPKGTGAFALAVADNTATGGNKRGTNAVDLQKTRAAAAQVASGANSFAAGFGNVASGDTTIAIGRISTANATYSIAIGSGAVASGNQSVALGFNCNAVGNESIAMIGGTTSAQYSLAIGNTAAASNTNAVAIGQNTTASGLNSLAVNRFTTADAYCSNAFGNATHTFGVTARSVFGHFNTALGDCQKSIFALSARTTNTTATTLTVGGSAASTSNQVNLQNNSVYRFKGTIVGKQSGSTTSASAWDVDGLIVRGASAAATTLIVGNVNLVSNTPAWGTPTLVADTTNGGLQVQVIGAAATNIQWTAIIETTEVRYL